MALDMYQNVTDQVIQLLEQGVAPWHRPWNVEIGAPKNLVSGKEYRGVNMMLLGVAPFRSPYWLTYKQAQDKGGHVKRGERGLPIVFWKVLTKQEDRDGETHEIGIPLLRHYTVFNVEQCEGIEKPQVESAVPATENERIEKAEMVQLCMPNRPAVYYDGVSAYYNPSLDEVHIPPLEAHVSSGEFYSTLFHELAHSTGHESRLNRHLKGGFFMSEKYGKEELVAEMTAAFLCSYCGIETTINNSASYLNSWIKTLRGDKKLVVVAAASAQKAADYILNRKPEDDA